MSMLPARGSAAARRAAWVVALAADALQIALFPLFGEGFASAANDALDLAVGALLLWLLGWHLALLPALVAELLPAVDLVPTWTAAVFLATRGSRAATAAGPAQGPPPTAGGSIPE
jgi:hypothetical protein